VLWAGLVEEFLDLPPVVAALASRGSEIGEDASGGPAGDRAGMHPQHLRYLGAG
jgi:GntR family transcriptional regulator